MNNQSTFNNSIYQRCLDIDVVSGIMICWMMLGHVMTSAGDNLVTHTYPYLVSITIPFFLYKAGMLCHLRGGEFLY